MSRTKDEIIEALQKQHELFLEEKKVFLARNAELEERNKTLEALVLFLKRQKYLPKSEVVTDAQLSIFNEAETESQPEFDSEDALPQELSNQRPEKTKKSTGRKKLPDWIEREDVIIDLKDSDKVCPNDGSNLKKSGEEVSEKLKIIPLQIKVIRTTRYKYACTQCECCQSAPVPLSLIPQSIATPETLAFVAVSKYEDALPLYRIENILERNQIPISRATLANWMIKSANACLPVINLMKDDLLSSSYMHMDETTVQVLDEDDRKAISKSYMWVQLSTAENKKIVLFNYDPSRSGMTAKNLLQGFTGHLQVDGYAGYNFTEEKLSKIIRISCLAHIRRKFKILFDDKTLRSPYVVEVIQLIRKIYEKESQMGYDRVLEKEKVIDYKTKYIDPLLKKLKELLQTKHGKIPPQTPLGEAIHYAVNELPLLIKSYSKAAEIRLDNNLVENAIRPFAIGRKNWLFSQSVAGAEASSVIYSLIESSKLNQLDPYLYLQYLFQKIPHCQKLEDFEKLLPYKIKSDLLTRLN